MEKDVTEVSRLNELLQPLLIESSEVDEEESSPFDKKFDEVTCHELYRF